MRVGEESPGLESPSGGQSERVSEATGRERATRRWSSGGTNEKRSERREPLSRGIENVVKPTTYDEDR